MLAKEARSDNAGFVEDQKVIGAKKLRQVAKNTVVRAVVVEYQQAAFVAPERRLLRDQFFGQLVIVRRRVPLIARDR
jgi:hypothetical protein